MHVETQNEMKILTESLLFSIEDKIAQEVQIEEENVDFFEGIEKLFEIWFEKDETSKSLRTLPLDKIVDLLKLVNCEIISKSSNEYMDAYVLSESSLFVYDQKFILKTCGTTTLLPSVPRILQLAQTECNLSRVHDLFYSRKNFLAPEKQLHPHGSFEQEVAFLDTLFGGAAYALGRLNGDVWYLYTLDKKIFNAEDDNNDTLNTSMTTTTTNPNTTTTNLTNGISDANEVSDQTLEILMHDLGKVCADRFFKKNNNDGPAMSKATGIDKLFDGDEVIIDSTSFDPCGYSVNGLIGASYFTIHVTPQPECSYASFETNYPHANYNEMINKVLDIFQPQRCTITVFASENAVCGQSTKAFVDHHINNYRRSEKQYYEFSSYNLNYGHFVRKSVN